MALILIFNALALYHATPSYAPMSLRVSDIPARRTTFQ